jgi:acyl carrier protein
MNIHTGSIEERVKREVAFHVDRPWDEIKNDESLINDLYLDSLDSVEVVIGLEAEFDLEISDEQAEKFVTVQDLLDYVTAKTS